MKVRYYSRLSTATRTFLIQTVSDSGRYVRYHCGILPRYLGPYRPRLAATFEIILHFVRVRAPIASTIQHFA